MLKEIYKTAQERMNQTITVLKKGLSGVRTGRASPALLDGVLVEYYGNPTPLNQLASVSVPESRLMVIQPWDPTVLGEVEKALLRSNLGLTPTNDGKVIRIAIPPLTEERRRELVKVSKKMAEECRVSLRNIRREINAQVKDLEKQRKISEDELHRSQGEIQNLTDNFIEQVSEIIQRKEREILEI